MLLLNLTFAASAAPLVVAASNNLHTGLSSLMQRVSIVRTLCAAEKIMVKKTKYTATEEMEGKRNTRFWFLVYVGWGKSDFGCTAKYTQKKIASKERRRKVVVKLRWMM